MSRTDVLGNETAMVQIRVSKPCHQHTGGPTSVNSRVQKHRDRLRAVHRRRVDVHLPNHLVEAATSFAKQHQRPLRSIIVFALQDYLTRHGMLPPPHQKDVSMTRSR